MNIFRSLLVFFLLSVAATAQGATCSTFAAGDLTYITKLNALAAGCTPTAVPDFALPRAAAAGTANAITADFTPDVTLTDKMTVAVIAASANSTTTPTFAPDGLTARTITARGGAALLAGDIAGAGFVALLEYNLANTRWELLNPAATKAGTTAITGVSGTGSTVMLTASPTTSGTFTGAAANFSGNVNVAGVAQVQPTPSTLYAYQQFISAGGSLYVGMDSSTGSGFSGGAYGTIVYRPASTLFTLSRAGTADIAIDGSGLVNIPAKLGIGGAPAAEKLEVNAGNVKITNMATTLGLLAYNSTTHNFSITRQDGLATGATVLSSFGPIGFKANETSAPSAAPTFVLTTDARLYGTALHNNGGAITGTTNQYIASGTYTPTLGAITNVSSSTANANTQFMRVGNVASVSGQISLTPTAAATPTTFTISLPPTQSNNFGASSEGAGTFGVAGVMGSCQAGVPNQNMSCTYTPTSNAPNTINIHFQYTVK